MKRISVVWALACSSVFAQSPLSLEQIGADPGLWPAEVMVVVDHKLPIVNEGKITNTLKVGPGHLYRVKSIDGKGVTIHGLGSTLTFAADETDVMARAEQLKIHRETPPVATPEPVPREIPIEPRRGPPASGAQPTSATAPVASGDRHVMARKLAGMLVRLVDGRLEPFDAEELAGKKFLAVYFSAAWCGPCRRFTPKLVEWYHFKRRFSDKFEVIFASADENEDAMKSYMVNGQMAWPALRFNARGSSPLAKYAGSGIPCVVILDTSGRVVSSSYRGNTYLGPAAPLRDLDRLLDTP